MKSDDVSRWPLCAKNYTHACHVSCVSGRCAPIGPCLPYRYQQTRCRVQLCMQGVPRFYRTGSAVVALFCSVCVWFLMSDKLFSMRSFWVSTEVVLLQRCYGWCHMNLQPSRRMVCLHHTIMHHVTSCRATGVMCMRV